MIGRQGSLDLPAPVVGFSPGAGEVNVSLRSIIQGRLLITASSGAGKSYLLRQLAEQTCDQIPQLIIDWEGEFASLRDIHHYVIVGACDDGADIEASVSTAGPICRRLMVSGASVIVDVSEHDVDERREYVGLFLDELMRLPKKDRHPRLCLIDEAHEFCPQEGSVASSKALKALVSRGRKRGYGAVLASQRLAKLHKDVSETANRIILQTTLDVDLARAADELGFGKNRIHEIEQLPIGTFFAKGRAFPSDGGVIKLRSADNLRSDHPDGTTAAVRVPAPAEIAEALKSLKNLGETPIQDAGRQELTERVERLQKELAAAKDGNSSDPLDIKRAVEGAKAPLTARIRELELQLEWAKQHARAVLLGLGIVPGGIVVETDAPNLDPEQIVEQQISCRPANGFLSDEDYEKYVWQPLGDRDETIPTPDQPSEVRSPLGEIEERMLTVLRSTAEAAAKLGAPADMTSEDLATSTGQHFTSSLFRAKRKALVDAGLAFYPRRGYIAATTKEI